MDSMQRIFKSLGNGLLSYMGYASSTTFQNPSFEGKDVECPICLQMPNEEIYQCKNGHMICASCCSEVATCPQCRCNLKVNGALIRNRLAESLVAKISVPCPAAQDGCSFQGTRDQMKLHKKECKYMINSISLCKLLGYKCEYLTRSSQKEKVIRHFVECHEARDIQLDGELLGLIYQDFSDMSEEQLLKAYRPVFATMPDKTSFLVYMNKNKKLMAWSCLQLHNFNKAYEFEFFVPGSNAKVRPITVMEPVKTLDDMKLDFGGIGLRYGDLQKLYTVNDEFRVEIYIYRVTKQKRQAMHNK